MIDLFIRQRRAKRRREIQVIAAVLLFAIAVVAFWIGRQTITPPTLSDLSQQRARDIAVAVYQECTRSFERGAMGLTAILRMSNRCNNVADVALEEVYAAGVEKEDRVMEEAKKMAREAKP